MLTRVGVILWNTYREAVRARILHGLFGLAVATALYAIVVGKYATKNSLRMISDIGSFSISSYAILVAIVMGATSLYRELELKTVFPILARPMRRGEYLAGKYLGTLFTLLVFMAANAGIVLLCLAATATDSLWSPTIAALIISAAAIGLAWSRPAWRTFTPVAFAGALLVAGIVLAAGAPDDRRVVLSSVVLAMFEVAIVAALANLFSSFSSPFLTAVFTFGVFLVGRSADTLASFPEKVFGAWFHQFGAFLARIFPNLMTYVPPRNILTGQASGVSLREYLALAGVQSVAWSAGLLLVAAMIFRKRDFI